MNENVRIVIKNENDERFEFEGVRYFPKKPNKEAEDKGKESFYFYDCKEIGENSLEKKLKEKEEYIENIKNQLHLYNEREVKRIYEVVELKREIERHKEFIKVILKGFGVSEGIIENIEERFKNNEI